MSVYLNRDVSWLKFNERVLNESKRSAHPLLERALFLKIASNNLKEFSMIRIGSLKALLSVEPSHIDWRSGWPLDTLIQVLNEEINAQREAILKSGKALLSAFSKEGYAFIAFNDLNDQEKSTLLARFKKDYYALSYRMRVSLTEFLMIVKSNRLYRMIKTASHRFYQVEFIDPPPYAIPVDKGRFVRTDDLLYWLFLEEGYEYFTANFIRNADIDYDAFYDDHNELPKTVRKLIKKRRTLDLVRLHLKTPNLSSIKPFFKRRMTLSEQEIYGADDFESWEQITAFLDRLIDPQDKRFRYPKHQPAWPVTLEPKKSLLKQVLKVEQLWHYPYDSFMAFEMLLQEAALSAEVEHIYITVYRLAQHSHLIDVLKMARKKGKHVTVVLELRARFEEDNNLKYAQELEAVGCQILFGPKKIKLHAKVLLITFKDGQTLTQIGSGNYHEVTAQKYTDFAYITARKEIANDALLFFNTLKSKKEKPLYQHLWVAPHDLKSKLLAMIAQETSKKHKGYIGFKVNALTDKDIINHLIKASQAGVRIDAIIRSIHCLKPGVEVDTETFYIHSIVGRFLEHSRVYIFGRKDPQIYVGSSDLMSRNLQRRHEILCPVYEKTIQKRLLKLFDMSLQDTTFSSTINANGEHIMKTEDPPFSVQETLIDYAKKGRDYL